jgi:Hint domain
MSERNLASPTRRHLFRVAAAATGSLSMMGFPSSARAHFEWRHDHDKYDPDPPQNCFLRGTRILTPKGEAPVEEIAIGDGVVTERGQPLAVKWIGTRRFKFKNLAEKKWPEAFLPVRIARYALDGKTPRADLYVSPAHCLFIDGLLIPAGHLINHVSIVQAMPEGVEEIEYFHIELKTHEVIYAEGAAVETLLVTSDREDFDNFVEYQRLYGKDEQPPMRPYAPTARYDGGRSELRALLRRLASPVVDIRDPIQIAYDKIAARAGECVDP